MTQTFNIERFRKPSPLYWTLVLDLSTRLGRTHAERTFKTEDEGFKAFIVAKSKRGTYSATLWRHNVDTGAVVKVSDFDRGAR